MEELRERVVAFQSRWNVAPTERLDFYTGSLGQNYAILVTKGLWYKVRLFVENKQIDCLGVRLNGTLLNGERVVAEQDILADRQYWTSEGVEERIDEIRNFFKEFQFIVSHQKMDRSGFYFPYFLRDLPKDYPSDPDKYLKRGDIIATLFLKVLFHTAIYLGNGKVAHLSGHGRGKAEGVARIGRLIGDFVSKGGDAIWIMCVPFRIRPREEIATKAEELAKDKFGDGKYNLLWSNCQHFVLLCATGKECIGDINEYRKSDLPIKSTVS